MFMDNLSKEGASLPLWGSMRWNVHYKPAFPKARIAKERRVSSSQAMRPFWQRSCKSRFAVSAFVAILVY